MYHLLIGENSPLVGKLFSETQLADHASGIHVMEVRRSGARLMIPLSRIVVEKNDRFLVAIHRRRGGAAKPETLFAAIGAQVLSTVDGIVSELVVRDESSLLGQTLAASDFRQNYNCVVLAVHRNGLNITSHIADLPLDAGDTLLVITPLNNLDALAATRDFVLTDSPEDLPEEVHVKKITPHVVWSWVVLVGVVLVATLTDVLNGFFPAIPIVPIHYAAMVGALLLLWLKVITPRDAYTSIDWQVLLMLYGLLGLGMAMKETHTAEWLARNLVQIAEHFVSPQNLPLVLLWLVFLLTICLTEVLSNNATAVMLVPIVFTLANEIGVNPRPFLMAVTVAASTAFALPMGYQTHMMVYGPGGYKFSDFLRVGIPLNLICWVVSCLLIPHIWPF